MEITKTSNFTCHSKSFISIFFTCQVSACELQPFSCHDLANDIHSQTAKTVLSHLKAPALFNLINNNRKEKSLLLVTMVAKLLDLNKAWSCKYIRKKKQNKNEKIWHAWLLCMIALRNKMVTHSFFPWLDNANGRLCHDRLLRSRNPATMVTWRHSSPLYGPQRL